MEQRGRSLLVELACALLLVLAAARLFQLDRQLFAEMRNANTRFAGVPMEGSLKSLGLEHPAVAPKGKGHHVLLFVVHASSMKRDLDFWNAVAQLIESQTLDVHLVGVCDEGTRCETSRESASFRLVAFLDPYQSHILATMDARGDAALYRNGSLAGQLSTNTDPAAVSTALTGALK